MPLVNPHACSICLRVLQAMGDSLEGSSAPHTVLTLARIRDAQALICKVANSPPKPHSGLAFTTIRRSLVWNEASLSNACRMAAAGAKATQGYQSEACALVYGYLSDIRRDVESSAENYSSRIFRHGI